MSEFEKYCKRYVEYIGGDINSDEYKIYTSDPFPIQIWKDKNKEIQQLKAKIEELEKAIRIKKRVR